MAKSCCSHREEAWRHSSFDSGGLVAGGYAGLSLLATALLAVFLVGGASAVTNSPSNFESADGNMTVQGTSATDWNCFANGGSSNTSGFVTSGINKGTGTCAKTTGATAVAADQPASVGEVTWVKGQKLDKACRGLTGKSTPPKDDFTYVAGYEEFATNGDLFFYGGSIRSTANANERRCRVQPEFG